MDWETVIGLEVHVELKTATKIWCNCSTKFGAPPNTNVCPVCLGLPGVLPVLNEQVLAYAIRTGLAFHCEIAPFSKFDRKNYYYPDLPKNYQISQYDLPIAVHGYLEINAGGRNRRVGITRVHMEDDAGKLVHAGATITEANYTLVDYNRTGVPLLEIVSEPDMRSPEEARAYLEKLKTVLQYLDVSDCKMEEGSLRCDANISLRPVGSTTFGTKTELKNLNSFRAVQKGLEYEQERQMQVLEDGGRVVQETRTWDETRNITQTMRSKEEAHDYRYFPDPDLVPIVMSAEKVAAIRATLPEMPDARQRRFMDTYGLSEYDAAGITASRALADYFEAVVKRHGDAKAVANWLMGEMAKHLNSAGVDIAACPVSPENLAALLDLLARNTISGKIAKSVFDEMFATGKDPQAIVKEKGLVQISDAGELQDIVAQVVAAHPQSVADFQAGKDRALGFLVGQVMKQTHGRANPELVNKLLRQRLAR